MAEPRLFLPPFPPASAYSPIKPSRSCASVRVSSRDTCIWEMPTSSPICDWVMLAKNRSMMICRSRGGSLASSGLSDSRYSTPSSAVSS